MANLDIDRPRVAAWQGEIPFNDCCDELGTFDVECPMSVIFNVIPSNKPIPAIIQDIKNNGGLRGYARCVASHVGTVSTEAVRQVALSVSDDALVRLLESLNSQAGGFVIYDLSRTELFSNVEMWNNVTENAPDQSSRFLHLGLCQSFAKAVQILEEGIQRNFQRRRRVSFYTHALVPITLGISCIVGDSFQRKYTLVNRIPFPVDLTLTSDSYRGIITEKCPKQFLF